MVLRPRQWRHQTKKSRRTLALPARCVTALAKHRESQAEPSADRLVFASAAGTALDRHNVLRAFRQVVARAGLDQRDWAPRELRHSFVSLLSSNGVSIEDIADLCGHSGTTITESVYRHQLRPVLLSGAVAMDRIFGVDPESPA
jgi:integrase